MFRLFYKSNLPLCCSLPDSFRSLFACSSCIGICGGYCTGDTQWPPWSSLFDSSVFLSLSFKTHNSGSLSGYIEGHRHGWCHRSACRCPFASVCVLIFCVQFGSFLKVALSNLVCVLLKIAQLYCCCPFHSTSMICKSVYYFCMQSSFGHPKQEFVLQDWKIPFRSEIQILPGLARICGMIFKYPLV
jgi:hypothetical protein